MLHDYLKRRVADETVVKDVLANGNRFYHPEVEPFFLPLEFTVAGFRFGHTMVRNVYDYNLNFPEADLFLLFTFTAFSGQLGFDAAATLPENWIIQWERFITPGGGKNKARRFDTTLAAELFNLQTLRGEREEPADAANLAVRNLLRGYALRIPTGQAVAKAMNLNAADAGPAAQGGPGQRQLPAAHGRGGRRVRSRGRPLWYYLLAEAKHHGKGNRLGPVGSTAGRRGPGRPGGAQRRLHPAGAQLDPEPPRGPHRRLRAGGPAALRQGRVAAGPRGRRRLSAGAGRLAAMLLAVVGDGEGGGLLQAVAEDGTPRGPVERAADLAAAVGERERAQRPRWLWAATAGLYPGLLAAGVRVERCHDLGLTEQILLAADGRFGEPRSFPAALGPAAGPAGARRHRQRRQQAGASRRPVRPRPARPARARRAAGGGGGRPRRPATPPGRGGPPGGRSGPVCCVCWWRPSRPGPWPRGRWRRPGCPGGRRCTTPSSPSCSGPGPRAGTAPRRLGELAAQIGAAFGGQPLNPDSPAQVLRAFANAGTPLPSTRSHVLRAVDHPAVPLLLAYKELSRLHAAHGWTWLDAWVAGGRFRPEYVPGGVVSGRWATRGGGALQIPHALRRAVVADPGWTFVVADASQLEPRVLAALSGDDGLARAAAGGDLYAALAADAFGGDRARAKTALLAAMYGGDVGSLMTVLRRRFPAAVGYVEAAARAGEEGALVRSRLGRTCPPPSGRLARPASPPGPAGWPLPSPAAGADAEAGARAAGGQGPGAVHPQLRGPGQRRRLGPGAAGRRPPPPGRPP